MAVLFSFAYLAAIFVSGTVGSYYLEGLYKPETASYVEKHSNELNPWERELWDHRNDPRWLQTRDFRHFFRQHDQRHVHSGSVKARRKPGVHTKRVDQTWSREEDTSRRLPGYIPRRDEGPLNGHRRTVPLAKDEFSANDLWLLMPDDVGWNKGKARAALLKGNPGRSEPDGTLEKEVKNEADVTTATETDITETVSSKVEETWTTSDLDKVDDTVQTVQESEATVKETARSTVDPKELLPSTTTFLSSSSEIVSSSTWKFEDTTSPSMTIFPSSEVTARKTVSTTPSTAGESSSEGISPSKTPVPSSTVTASETASSTPTTPSDSSSEGTSPSTSTVTASETVSLTPSTPEGSSSGATSPSTFTASKTFSPTTSTTGGSSSSPVPDHVIVLPRIRTARIVLSSVLLAVGLVAVGVAAVCIFRERRRKLKYDQLKLLP